MLVLMTDDERLADPIAAARLLPKGTMIIVRSRDCDRRKAWANALVALGRTRQHIVLIANDADLAMHCGADGLHLAEANACQAVHWRALRPQWFISVAAHSARVGRLAEFLDAVLLSPVFPTASHPGTSALLPVRANKMAAAFNTPVYALGGVTACNAVLLHGFSGIAAIGGLAP